MDATTAAPTPASQPAGPARESAAVVGPGQRVHRLGSIGIAGLMGVGVGIRYRGEFQRELDGVTDIPIQRGIFPNVRVHGQESGLPVVDFAIYCQGGQGNRVLSEEYF